MNKTLLGLGMVMGLTLTTLTGASAAGIPDELKHICQENDNLGAANLGQCIKKITGNTPKTCKSFLVPRPFSSVGECVSFLRQKQRH